MLFFMQLTFSTASPLFPLPRSGAIVMGWLLASNSSATPMEVRTSVMQWISCFVFISRAVSGEHPVCFAEERPHRHASARLAVVQFPRDDAPLLQTPAKR